MTAPATTLHPASPAPLAARVGPRGVPASARHQAPRDAAHEQAERLYTIDALLYGIQLAADGLQNEVDHTRLLRLIACAMEHTQGAIDALDEAPQGSN